MGLALEAVRDWLITTYTHFDRRHCGVQFRCYPPLVTPTWYVAVDDAGVSAVSKDNQYMLGESLNMEVGIWRRQESVPAEKSDEFLLNAGVYRPAAQSLDKLEREVLKLHMNFELLLGINAIIAAAPATYGECVSTPLVFKGRGPNELLSLPWDGQSPDVGTYIGRRLKFTGLFRWGKITAPLTIVDDATLTPVSDGLAMSHTFGGYGGTPPYSWSLVSGSLPTGLTLSPGGVLSGTPDISGGGVWEDGVWDGMTSGTFRYVFTVRATDSAGTPNTYDKAFTLWVLPTTA